MGAGGSTPAPGDQTSGRPAPSSTTRAPSLPGGWRAGGRLWADRVWCGYLPGGSSPPTARCAGRLRSLRSSCPSRTMSATSTSRRVSGLPPSPRKRRCAKGSDDLAQVLAQRLYLRPFWPVTQCLAQALDARLDELLDVVHNALLELAPVILPLRSRTRRAALRSSRIVAWRRSARSDWASSRWSVFCAVISVPRRKLVRSSPSGRYDREHQRFSFVPTLGSPTSIWIPPSGVRWSARIRLFTAGGKSSWIECVSISSRVRSKMPERKRRHRGSVHWRPRACGTAEAEEHTVQLFASLCTFSASRW